jgi:hypothetical protein
MRRVLKTERGSQLYKQRAQVIEPIFGHTKHTADSPASTGAADRPSAPNGG